MQNLSIKNFRKGLITDGDTTDLQNDTFKVIRNFDIDKTSLHLITRRGYDRYTTLGNLPQEPFLNSYVLYWVVKYDIGISTITHCTLLVYRNTIDPMKWQVYSNALTGGDSSGGGNFIQIWEESGASFCTPIAVAGKVRLALGNEKNYRIFMPHDRLEYFPTGTGYLVNDVSTLLPSQNGIMHKSGDIINGQTIEKGHIYLDGRLYSNYNNATAGLSVSKTSIIGTPLFAGTYNFLVAPKFDTNPPQYGAPVAKGSATITRDPVEVQTTASTLQDGITYNVFKQPIYSWKKRDFTLTYSDKPDHDLHLEYDEVYFLSDSGQSDVGIIRYYFPHYPNSPNAGKLLYKYSVSDSHWYESTATVAEYTTNGWHFTYSFSAYILTADDDLEFVVEYPLLNYNTGVGYWLTTGGGKFKVTTANGVQARVHTRSKSNLATSLTQTALFNAPIPYYPELTITNPNSDLLFWGGGEGGLLSSIHQSPGAVWTLSYAPTGNPLGLNRKLIDASVGNQGELLRVTFNTDTENFNPRITHFCFFLQKEIQGVVDPDYILTKEVSIREDNGYFWSSSGTDATIGFDLNTESTSENLGFWSVLYGTGDGDAFRPYNHTEADITRKFGVIVNRKERMYAGLIDDDEGQEIIGYTPISNGYGQMDVWYRPLIMYKGSGQANTWLVEWNDRILQFQKNNLWYADVGDKPGFEYQFHSTGFGTGTHIYRTIAKNPRAVFWANYDGIFRFQGNSLVDITINRISKFWRYGFTKLEKDLSFAGFNDKTNEYWLAVPKLSDEGLSFVSIVPDPYSIDASLYPIVPIDQDKIMYWDIIIWDDDEVYGHNFRTYRTGMSSESVQVHKPVVFFADRNNDWVFVTYDGIPYFWSGNHSDVVKTDDPNISNLGIRFNLETQYFGSRDKYLIPDKLQIVKQQGALGSSQGTDITVDIRRNGSPYDGDHVTTLSTSTKYAVVGALVILHQGSLYTDGMTFTTPAGATSYVVKVGTAGISGKVVKIDEQEFIYQATEQRKRKVQRRKGRNTQIKLSGNYTGTGDKLEVREINFDFMMEGNK